MDKDDTLPYVIFWFGAHFLVDTICFYFLNSSTEFDGFENIGKKVFFYCFLIKNIALLVMIALFLINDTDNVFIATLCTLLVLSLTILNNIIIFDRLSILNKLCYLRFYLKHKNTSWKKSDYNFCIRGVKNIEYKLINNKLIFNYSGFEMCLDKKSKNTYLVYKDRNLFGKYNTILSIANIINLVKCNIEKNTDISPILNFLNPYDIDIITLNNGCKLIRVDRNVVDDLGGSEYFDNSINNLLIKSNLKHMVSIENKYYYYNITIYSIDTYIFM